MRRVAMISYHTSPLAPLGGPETGGMNVYVRQLSRELGQRGFLVDVFTRRQDASTPDVVEDGENVRVVHLEAGPRRPVEKGRLRRYLDQFEENLVRFASAEGSPTTCCTATTGSRARWRFAFKSAGACPTSRCSTPWAR